MTKVPFVHSGYKRKENDNYQTVDPRCTDVFLRWLDEVRGSQIVRSNNIAQPFVDVCAPSGSGIVDRLVERGFGAIGVADAFDDTLITYPEYWIISNPPYSRPLVDNIVRKQIERIDEGRVYDVAMLLRANFDFAKSRVDMFGDCDYYEGQIKMLFRPIWIEGEQKAQPIHNFVWHIWSAGCDNKGYKKVWYFEE